MYQDLIFALLTCAKPRLVPGKNLDRLTEGRQTRRAANYRKLLAMLRSIMPVS